MPLSSWQVLTKESNYGRVAGRDGLWQSAPRGAVERCRSLDIRSWAQVTPLNIDTFHLDPRMDAIVRDWFGGRITGHWLDGSRSVLFAHPDDPARVVKIKGGGLYGRPVQWDGERKTGPRHPVFDFDGRMSEDVAFGHDNALPGGASFQQAVTEWAASGALAAAGEAVVPCAGYGRLRHDGRESWFSVLDLGAGWHNAIPEEGLDPAEWQRLVRQHGGNVARIAKEHGLVGYFWYLARPDGTFPIKDVHPFRRTDPLSMSAISWVLTVYYGIHIFCNHVEFSAIPTYGIGLPPEAKVWPLTSLCPDMTVEDHARLRAEVVKPYIVNRPEKIDIKALWQTLCSINVTARLIELCPDSFARP